MNPEVWGPAYLGCLFALLLFSFGFPALLIQIVAPKEDVRSIVMPQLSRATILLGVFLTLAAGSLVWHLSGRSGLSESAIVAYGSIVVFVATGITATACSGYMSALSRQAIVKQVVARFSESSGGRSVSVEAAAAALTSLGPGSAAGTEKGYILDAIAVLLSQTIADSTYDGTRCAAPLESVKRTLLAPSNAANAEDFRRGGEVLIAARKQILEARGGELKNCSDVLWVTNALGELVLAAALSGYQVSQDLLEYLPPEKLLEVAVAAWHAGRVATVGYAATRLRARHNLAKAGTKLDSEAADYNLALFLALLAHLAAGGPAARQWSAERLAAVRQELEDGEFEEALDRAWRDRYTVGDWASADAVHEFKKSLKETPLAPSRARGKG